MKIALCGDILRVTDLTELDSANSDEVRRGVTDAMPISSLKAVEIDLSRIQLLDSCGLGALIAVRKSAASHNGNGAIPVRLLNPPPPVQEILELTRLHHNFEIVKKV